MMGIRVKVNIVIFVTRIWFWAYIRPEGPRYDFCEKKKLRKKLGFIPYKQHFVIPLKFIKKLSPLPVVFPHKDFHVNLVFFFILYFFIVSLIITRNIDNNL